MRRLSHIVAVVPDLARFVARVGEQDFPTPDELAEARTILAGARALDRIDLFTAPPSRGSCPDDEPSLPAGGAALLVGQ